MGAAWIFAKRLGFLRNPVISVEGEFIHDDVDRKGQPADENDQRNYDRFVAWIALVAAF
jgi:hypothetical protein